MNGVTPTALSVSGEGLYTSITAGLCLELCGKVLVTELDESPQCYKERQLDCL